MDLCMDMRMDMSMEMRMDTRMDICMNMRMHMYMDMCMNKCADMPFHISSCSCVLLHVGAGEGRHGAPRGDRPAARARRWPQCHWQQIQTERPLSAEERVPHKYRAPIHIAHL